MARPQRHAPADLACCSPGLASTPPSSLIGGEALLARIYDAIRSSSSPTGSNYFNTLFMVVFDEHGGTYDHVPPPAADPPDPAGPAGQMGFTFDRLGIRLPAIAISPWIPEKTVVNDTYHHTSVIRTMRERWNLGAPLTARDARRPRHRRGPHARPAARARGLARRRPAARARLRRGAHPARPAALAHSPRPSSPDAWHWRDSSARPCPRSKTPPPSPAPRARTDARSHRSPVSRSHTLHDRITRHARQRGDEPTTCSRAAASTQNQRSSSRPGRVPELL